jgi:hypothetical protein
MEGSGQTPAYLLTHIAVNLWFRSPWHRIHASYCGFSFNLTETASHSPRSDYHVSEVNATFGRGQVGFTFGFKCTLISTGRDVSISSWYVDMQQFSHPPL